jgi:hypothetical protein
MTLHEKVFIALLFALLLLGIAVYGHCEEASRDDHVIDSLKRELSVKDSLRWELQIVEMKKAQIDSLKKELSK